MPKLEVGYMSYIGGQRRICPQCKKEYIKYPEYIEYKYDKKKFCTWQCKMDYKKAHPPVDDRK